MFTLIVKVNVTSLDLSHLHDLASKNFSRSIKMKERYLGLEQSVKLVKPVRA